MTKPPFWTDAAGNIIGPANTVYAAARSQIVPGFVTLSVDLLNQLYELGKQEGRMETGKLLQKQRDRQDAVDLLLTQDEDAIVVAPPPRTTWQDHGAACPRAEFLATFRQAHAALHRLWTAATGGPDYDKPTWMLLDVALGRFGRDAAEKVGIPRTEPLLP